MEKKSSIDIDRDSGTVLLVDDGEMVIGVSRDMLEKFGYPVREPRRGGGPSV